MHRISTITLLTIAVLLSSCAFHRGYLSSNAVIIDQNFQVLGVAKGTSQTTKILGIGGLEKDALVYNAKNDLYDHINLEPGQALTNITVDFKNSFFVVVSKQKVTVTAEVIDFNTSQGAIPNNYGPYGFLPSDSIFVKINDSYQKAVVDKVLISGISVINPETNRPETVIYDHCFNRSGSFVFEGVKYSTGDFLDLQYHVTVNGFRHFIDAKGKLLGVNETYFIVKNGDQIQSHLLP